MVLVGRNYGGQLRKLLPPGRILPVGPDSVLRRFLDGLGEGLRRLDARACALLDEADPRTTSELLEDWERVMGLPDSCAPTPTNLAERRNAVVARLVDVGGQTPQFFVDLCAVFGFAAQIVELVPFEFGRSRFGDTSLLGGPEWRFAWIVRLPAVTVRRFEFGASQFGRDLFQALNLPAALQCLIERLAPAHTSVTFRFDLLVDGSVQLLPLTDENGQLVHARVVGGAMVMRDASGAAVTVLADGALIHMRDLDGLSVDALLETPDA